MERWKRMVDGFAGIRPDGPADEGQDGKSKVLSALAAVAVMFGAAVLIFFIVLLVGVLEGHFSSVVKQHSTSSFIILAAHLLLLLMASVLSVLMGVKLWRGERRPAALLVDGLLIVLVVDLLLDAMLYGLSWHDVLFLVGIAFLVGLASYIDPALAGERAVQRRLHAMENRTRKEEGTLGRDESGKGYIELNFFNIFWIFVVCCVLGLAAETIFHLIKYGGYQDRAGLLFGPFSPIYGCGGLLMTIFLNRFHRSNPIIIFLFAALIGGTFEYLTSWFMQFAFGITAWNYTGRWLSIGGRTCGVYMIFWGLMGLAWIKLCLPGLLKLVNTIPWNWRYTVTVVCTVLMLIDCGMTLQSLDCWYQRQAGHQIEGPVEQFYAEHFDDAYMTHRFQTMTMDPDATTRVDG